MSIRFVCSCGKHLRARDDMASKRTVCPGCGRLVGVPSMQPTQRGTEADPLSLTTNQPLVPPVNDLRYHVVTLSETKPAVVPDNPLGYRVVTVADEQLPGDAHREARSREARFADPPVPDISLTALQLRPTEKRRRARRKWDLEGNVFQCLAFPLRARALLGWLAIALTLLLGVTAFEMPRFLEGEPGQRALWFVWMILPLVVVGYLCGFWHCVMCSAVVGEAGFVRWPGKDLSIVVEGVARCIGCLLAAPAWLLAAAFELWYHGGDLQWIDRLLLAELILVAAGYWLFAFLAVSEGDGLKYALPVHAVRVARRLGYRALIGTVAFGVNVAVHGAWAIATLTELHNSKFSGWFSVWVCTFSFLFWTTFLLRWLGTRSFLARLAAAPVREAAAVA